MIGDNCGCPLLLLYYLDIVIFRVCVNLSQTIVCVVEKKRYLCFRKLNY